MTTAEGGRGSIESLFAEPGGASGGPPERRRGRGWIVAGVVVVVLLVLLGIAAVLIDNGLRAAAESEAAAQIEKRLPDGVTGDVDVSIVGGSVILQYLSGSFDDVRLDAPGLTVDGVGVPVSVVARDIPTDLGKPVGMATATVRLSQDALNAFLVLPQAASALSLGDGTLGYDATQNVFGVAVGYHVTAKPKAAGSAIELTPTKATVTSGPAGLDVTSAVEAILGDKPVTVCVASHLPTGVELTGIAVTPVHAVLTLHATRLPLSASTLSTTGNCG